MKPTIIFLVINTGCYDWMWQQIVAVCTTRQKATKILKQLNIESSLLHYLLYNFKILEAPVNRIIKEETFD